MSESFCESVLSAVKSCLPNGRDFIALHEPCFAGNEWSYVKECLDTGWVSYKGSFVERFERDLAEFTGVKYAVVTVNGTAALHICIKLTGVKPGDEILLPSLTFVATANAVKYVDCIPHFVDSDEETLGLDPRKLYDYMQQIAEIRGDTCFNKRTNRPIRVVIPVHTFGHPVELDLLTELCERFKLTLIEDAAESLGSYYKGLHTGRWGKSAVLSFNGNKIITTGGGGAILTDDKTIAEQAKHLTTTARITDSWGFNHDQIGYNYRLPNINAAIGCAQLEQLPGFVTKKRNLAGLYKQVIGDIDGVRLFAEPAYARSNYWLNTLILDPEYEQERDNFLEISNVNGIMTRPAWKPMHRLPMFQDCPRMDLSVAESLEKRIINIPSSVFLYETVEAFKKRF